MKKPKTMKITEAQVAVVLDVIAVMEGWDGSHYCIAEKANGEWERLGEGDRILPKPSAKLLALIAHRLPKYSV